MGVLIRFLLFFAVGIVAWRFVKKLMLGNSQQASDTAARQIEAQPMVSCATCGVHLPASEAKVRDGKAYCNDHA